MNKNDVDVGGWILTVLFLIFFPPVGIFLLFRQLMGYNKRSKQKRARAAQPGYNSQYEYHYAGDPQKNQQKQPQSNRNTARVNLKNGKTLTVVGAIITAVFGIGFVTELVDFLTWGGWRYALPELVPIFCFMLAGLVVFYAGLSRTKKGKRFAKYLNLIGKRDSVSVKVLADTMGLSERKVCDDLDEMLERGLLPMGYLDRGRRMLILTDEGVKEPPKPQPEKKAEPLQKENDILREIQEVNDAIPDPEMSAKIDRIREITGKILDYQKKNPGKDAELRSFLDYYLPTTLKILRAYAQLDAQGIQGENISSSKARIEGMMDKVVEGFEKQLDKLFQADSLDIASDVQVLEQMLQKDGLSGGDGITLEL